MEITHDSRNGFYRSPFGALPAGSKVDLSVSVKNDDPVKDVFLCYIYGLNRFDNGRIYMGERAESSHDYTCSIIMPAEPCLLFYWFEISTESQITHHNKAQLSKDGKTVTGGYQITVYDPDFKTPDWLKKSVMYQIFPDRFARSTDFSVDKMMSSGPSEERILHEDWNEDVDIHGKEGHGYRALDFYGGSLDGIREKLDYFKSLGISVIYLNPIFRSRSNHRYDTGNYEEVDPMLGGEDAFAKLAGEFEGNGIRLILDGVFSHTGADSMYFNKYGRYNDTGAYQDAIGLGRSKWYSWYDFSIRHGKIYYDSWWNFTDLPNVNENDLTYREYILGENGIVRNWLRKGASGWRLDVSDELPDSFLRHLRSSAKNEDPDCVIMGEVWEDASNKVSYGGYRDFLLGRTHDCVMGYPFRSTLLDWLTGRSSAVRAIDSFEMIRENYPVQAYLCNMNLIGSHDVARALTALAGEPDKGTREWQSSVHLSADDKIRGTKLLKLAMLVQFTFPGVPSVYYGDEIAMEGYGDPFCRRTFDSIKAQNDPPEILLWLKAMSNFREKHSNLSTGHIKFVSGDDNILLFSRFSSDGMDMAGEQTDDEQEYYIAINPDKHRKTVFVENVSYELAGSSGVIISDGKRLFET